MTVRTTRATFIAALSQLVCLLGGAAAGQSGTDRAPLSDTVFKNVQVLKGIPVDQFMATMGFFSASLGMSCEDCHSADDRNWDGFAADNPRKVTTRRMITMMTTINRENFGGRQVVTCYSCHRGSDRPRATPDLTAMYAPPPPPDLNDLVQQAPGAPTADQVFDRYFDALGGRERIGAVTSLVARGTSAGYGPEAGRRPTEIFVKAPGLRTIIIHTANGDSTAAFDGRAGWLAAPLRPVAVLPLTGQELDGAKLDAELSLPSQIKQALGRWRVGVSATIDDHDVDVVQGTSPGGTTATLYFDKESGLLVRTVRYTNSPVGRIPTQTDYADYRDVAGVKIPFRWTMTWLDGRDTVELADVQLNVPIDAATFGRPAPPSAPK
jgi:photosynthetic reaction center cytochrome c subunit